MELITDVSKLRQPSHEWSGTAKELKEIYDSLYAIQEKHKGVGISAIQVGLPYRIFLAGPVPKVELFLNPKVTHRHPYMTADWEGCLSCPDAMVKIKRSKTITLEYTTIRDEKYVKIKRKFKDFDARVVQHELDHLNGFLILDRGKVYRP
tara:strand:+ start:588 stop:1037 length:450 start_codon:yes stop_codon:yes gene_type:complete